MVEYDAHLTHTLRPEGAGRKANNGKLPPQESTWAKCWVWLARGYAIRRVADEVGIPESNIRSWQEDPRFQAGMAAAEKAWDALAIRREVAEVERGEEPESGGRAEKRGPSEDVTKVLGG